MPDVETIMEPWMGDQPQDKEMPDFENADLLTVIDDVCGTCSFDILLFHKTHIIFCYFRTRPLPAMHVMDLDITCNMLSLSIIVLSNTVREDNNNT